MAIHHHALQKLAWHAGLGAWMALCYYPPQAWPLFPAREVPILAGEPWLELSAGWVLVYQFVFILHTAALWLPAEIGRVRSYALAVGSAYAVAAVFFWLLPMQVTRPPNDSDLYHWLISAVDGPRNAVPSLHVVMASLGVWWLRAGRPWWVKSLLAVLWMLMLCSTLATGQHRFLDVAAGLILSAALMALFGRKLVSL